MRGYDNVKNERWSYREGFVWERQPAPGGSTQIRGGAPREGTVHLFVASKYARPRFIHPVALV